MEFLWKSKFQAFFTTAHERKKRKIKSGKPVFTRLPGLLSQVDATGFEPAASASRIPSDASVQILSDMTESIETHCFQGFHAGRL